MDKINIKFNNPIMDQENIEKIAGKVNDVIDNGPELIAGKDIEPDDISATGKITGDEIVENMSGYDMSIDTTSTLTLNGVYGGVVKNGNKLTLVLALNITRTDLEGGSVPVVSIDIPLSIYNKLYPTTIGGYDALDFRMVNVIKQADNSSIPIGFLTLKQDNKMYVFIQGETVNDLPLNAIVYARLELTFLLSDNLIGE